MHYISNTPEEQAQMLKEIGVEKVSDLFKDIPDSVRLKQHLNLPSELSEMSCTKLLSDLASKNKIESSFLGAGAYNHILPTVVNHLLLRGEFFTAYTPYQPEISQGTLQSIFEYQTMVCHLTGMDVSNASLYDNSSALAESAIMACRIKRKNKILLSKTVHPQHREVVKTYAWANDINVVELDYDDGLTKVGDESEYAAIFVQTPNFFGCLEDIKSLADRAHNDGALLVVSVNEPTSLGLLKGPGELGADIVVGEGQSFGNAISFGGPYVGFMATKKEFLRQIPGRICGQTVDSNGKRGYVLTLQAREQHIRRERANSNICTNQALNALAMTITLSVYGKKLKDIALHNLKKAHYLKDKLEQKGFKPVFSSPFYNEFVVKGECGAGLNLGSYYPELKGHRLLCATEMNSINDINIYAEKL